MNRTDAGRGGAMRIVGAGLGRTGTHSLKLALERLLGDPCYHMAEVFEHLDHVPTWHAAIRGETVDWQPVLGGYAAIVDWPGAAGGGPPPAPPPPGPRPLSARP